jgi:hypothetical protein
VRVTGPASRAVSAGKNTLALTHSGLPTGTYDITVTLKAESKNSKAKTAKLVVTG